MAVAISDDVNVTIGGNVKAGGTGVFAASFAKADAHGGYTYTEQGNVTVSVKKGTVSGGNADGKAHYGIVVLGGDENLIEIGKKGAVTSKSHLAIYGGDQHETIRNYGLVDGSVVLNEAGDGRRPAELLQLWQWQVLLGLGDRPWWLWRRALYNAGALSPGGPGVILESDLNGNYLQTKTGKYAVDVNMGKGTSDYLWGNGWADLAGKVKPTLSNPFTGKQKVLILTADGGVINHGIRVKDTAVVDYSLKFPNPNDVTLKMNVNFAPKGLGKEANGVGSS